MTKYRANFFKNRFIEVIGLDVYTLPKREFVTSFDRPEQLMRFILALEKKSLGREFLSLKEISELAEEF